MAYLQRVFILPLLLLLVSCQMATNREAHRAQALLDEAELLMEARELDKAKEKAEGALTKLATLDYESSSNTVDFKLLEVRAHFTCFMASNLLTMENAKVQRKSLVRFPKQSQYVGYEKHLKAAEGILKTLVRSDEKYQPDQEGFIHGMLGALLRLNEKTLHEADREYAQAIRVYDEQLAEMKANPPKIGSNDGAIARLDNQVRSLKMAQAEVKLLAQEWDDALNRLESAMAGPDLQYFSVQFEILKNSIDDAQKELDAGVKSHTGSREQKLVQALDAKRRKKLTKREEFGSYNPYRMQLTLAKIQSSDTVNNLMYRMICFHQLKRRKEFEEARQILEEFYPELASNLELQLRRHG